MNITMTDSRMILAIVCCLILVHVTTAQECAVNQCPNGLTCYDRNVAGELPYVCECNTPFSQGVECTESSDNQEVFTCYGDACQSGSFNSINYPNVYNNRYRALYLLYVPGAQSITFSFSNLFDIEEFKDELYVGTGLMYNDIQLDGLGSPPDWYFFEGSIQPADFTIQGDVAWMYFGTDKNIQRTGFELSWSAAVDNTPPVFINCPSNIATNVEIGTPSTTVTWTVPTAVDASSVSTVSTHNPGQTFITGTSTTVVYTATDAFGNIGQCAFTVIVTSTDSIDPVVSVSSGFITRQVELGSLGTNVFYTEPTATDNSGSVSLFSRSAQPGDFFSVGQTIVTYIFQDGSGNQGTGTFTVNVVEVDTTAPVITISSGTITRQVELGTPGANVFYTEPTATDNSGTALLVSRSAQPGDFFPVGQTVVTYTFQDPSGNPTTGTFTVNVVEVDTTSPVVTVSSGTITRQVELGTLGANVFYTEPTATDNSGTVQLVSQSAQPGDFFPVGQTVVTYTFQDPSGNPATGTFTVNVVEVDTTAPVVTISSGTITRQVELGTPGANVFYTEPTATDNSGTALLVSRSAQPGDFFPVGQTVVTYTFQDPSGNPTSGTFTVNVVEVDTTAPVITISSGTITRQVELGTPGANVFYTEPTATDNSGTALLVSRSAQPGDFFPVGQTVVTYTFQDPSGNPTSGTFTVNVVEVDTTSPVVTVSSGTITRQVELGTSGTNVFYTEPIATDNSGTALLVSRSAQPGDFFPVGQTVVTYTFQDPSGNPATGTFTVNVVEVDTTRPQVFVTSGEVFRTAPFGSSGTTVFYTEPIAIDNSGTANLVSQSAMPGDFFPIGRTVVTYVYRDPTGNEATGTFTVVVDEEVDTIPPVILTAGDIIRLIETGQTGVAVNFTEPNATDSSSIVFLVNSTAEPGDFFLVGRTVVKYVFSDSSGNLAFANFSVTVLIKADTIRPVITVSGGNIVRTVELGVTRLSVVYPEPTATDNSGTANLVSRSAQPGDLFPVGTTNVEYVFADPTGNQASAIFTVTVIAVDTTPPTVNCVSNVFQEVELGTTSATVFFNEPTAFDISGQANLVSRTAAPGDSFPVGTTTVTYVFNDNSGNEAAPCSFTVTISAVDTTPPTVNCVNNVVQAVELGTSSAQVFFAEPTAFDISGQANLVTSTASPGDSFPVGVTSVTYIFADNSGNQAPACTFTITVNTFDTTPPTVNCISNIVQTIELGGSGAVINYVEPTASDISGTAFLLSRTNAPGETYPIGTTTVSYLFSDQSGNEAAPCVFTITVGTVDTMVPMFTGCPSNIVQSVELGTPGSVITWTSPTANDAAGIASIVANIPSGSFFTVGETATITYVATDNSGLTDNSCTFTVTIFSVDTTPPTVVCTNNVFQTVELGTTSTQVFYTEPTANDVSGQANLVSRTNVPGDSFPVGTTTVTYIFADNSGNTAEQCTFTITITAQDTTPPTVNCISDIVRTVELGTTGAQVFYSEPTASDAGQSSLISRTAQPGDNFPVGVTSVTYIFGDNSNNVADPCTFTITVNTVDTTSPVVTVSSGTITRQVELGTPGTNVFYTEPTATDLSGTAQLVSRTAQPGDFFPVGQTVVTYTFQDPSGNPATGTFTVNVEEVDTTPPVITVSSGTITREVELGTPGTNVFYTEPTATDISGTAQLVSRTAQPGDFFPVGQTVVTYTFQDPSGNPATGTFTVNVVEVDTTPPVITVSSGTITREVELGIPGTNVFYTEPTATDLSGTAQLVSRTAQPGDFFPVGQTVVTYTFQDPSGNPATGTFTVNVVEVDTTPPVITVSSGTITREVELGISGTNVFYTEPTATDISGTAQLVSRTAQPGDFFPVGQTVVTYTFQDPSGNPATGTFTVNVVEVDTTPPVITVSSGTITREVELGTPGTNVFYTEPTATDISGTAQLVSRTAQPGDFFPVGQTVVTYTFQDPSGNPATGTFTVNVVEVDTTPPVITVSSGTITRQVELGTPGTNVFYTEPTATDLSGTAQLVSRTAQPGDFFPVGQTVVTYTFQDPSGNPATGTFTVNVVEVDTTAPTVNCVSDITRVVELGTSSVAVFYTEPTASDISGTSTLVSQSNTPGDNFPVGTTVVSYFFSDASGNNAPVCQFTVVINTQDTTGPVVTNCPSNIVESVELGTAGTTVTFSPPQATDVSGIASIISSIQSGTFFVAGETRQVTYTVTDNSGLVDTSCTFTITIFSVDTTPPTVSCVSNVQQTVELGTTGTQVNYPEPTATDISGSAMLLSRTNQPGEFFPVGSTTVTYIFTDASGNDATPCTFTITVTAVDTTPPVITVSSGTITREVELGISGTNVFYTEPTATDISGTAQLVSRTAQPGDFFPVGQTVVTYTFQDPSGNPATGTFTVNVVEVDTTPPVITVSSGTITREVELGTPGTNVFYTEPTATDISGTAQLVSRTAQPGDFFPVGQTVVTYTFQDPSGNPATGTFTVNVVEVDTTPPVITVSSGTITREVELGNPGTNVFYTEPTATDISGTAQLVSRTAQPGDFFPVGQTVVTYTFQDPSGNPATGTFTVNVVEVDTTPPVITVSSGTITREVELGNPGTNVFYTEPTATDISGTAQLVSRTAQPGDFFPVGQTVVTYTFQDPSGNPATGTFTVNVVEVDTTPPVITVSSGTITREVELGIPGTNVFYTEPTATDISGTAQLVSRTAQPGDFFPVGQTVVTYTFQDPSGNPATGTFTVNVVEVDTTPPVVTVSSGTITRQVELGTSGTNVFYTEPTATDISGTAQLVSRTAQPGDLFPVGQTVVTYTFQDPSGNPATGTFTVNVVEVDTTPPSVVCTGGATRTVELGTTSVAVFFTEPTASDLSGVANLVSRSAAPGDIFPVGSTTVTYVFTDNAGNVADPCTFVIMVTTEDTTPPSVICSSTTSRTVELGTTSVPIFYNEPTATDISGQANLVTRTASPGDAFPVGVTTVTYIFADNSGNQADACTFTITVNTVDTTPPSVTCVDDIVRNVELGTSGTVIFYSEPTASDISGQALLSSRTNAPGDTFPVGTTVVTYIFTDASGNDADACVFTVTVTTSDTINPTVTDCPSDIVQTVELGITGTIITYTAPTATDLSGIASIVSNVQSGTFFSVGMSQQVTYTVTDNSGNTNTDCSFTVTVISVDTTPPSVSCVQSINEVVELGTPSLQINYPEPTATDISGTANLVSRTNLPGEFFPVGTTTVTYIFSDASGNEANPCSFTITVTAVDTTDPVVTCPTTPVIRTIELGNTGVVVFYTEPTAVDISGQVNLVSQTTSPGDFFPIGVTTVTYVFTDNSGNQADPCTFTVTINTVDTTPPTVQCIDNIFRNVELGTTSLVVFYSEPSATDISGQPLLDSRTNAPGDAFPIGTTTLSYVFTDPSGNLAAPCIFTVTVTTSDTTPPTVTNCPSSISQSVELGTTGTIITYTAPTAMDLSGITSIIPNIQSGTFFAVGETRQVTYTVTDNSGLVDTSCSFTVTIFSIDTTPPDVTCVMNIIQNVELGTQSVPITYTEPTAVDISGVAILTSQTHSSGNLFPVGQTTVTYIFTDGAGNEAAPCTFSITIIADDTTYPTVICTNDVVRTIELGSNGVEVFYQVPSATDISGTEEIISQTSDSGDFYPVGVTTVTYIFADQSGNVAPACTFTVTVNTVDTTAPSVQNCPQDIVVTVELGTASTPVNWAQPTATDISGTATIQTQTRQPGEEFAASTTTTINIIFIDASNNLADPCTFTVTVNTEDTTPPTVQNCPADIVRTIEINSATEVPITWTPPTATDVSGTQFILSQTANVGQSFPVGTTLVTYTFSDASGNDANPCSFNVIILTEDTTAPVVLNCPSGITETTPLNSGGTVITFIAPSAVDNSNQEPSVTVSNQPNTFFFTGDTTVTYTFTDQAGNPSTCSFTVTVIEVDTENPVIQNCPTGINVNTPLGTPLTAVTWATLIVSDNSGQTSVQSQSAVSGDSFPPGRTTVTIIYQDPSSNTDMCQFTVIVTEVDNTLPEILSCPSDITSEVPVESSGTTVIWTTPVVTDNSGLAPTVTSTSIPGSFFLRGATQVTYTFTDNSGNQVSCSFVVTVLAVDDVNPIVTCPANIAETVLEGVDNAYVTFDLPTVTDNNGATNLVSSTANSGDPFPVGTTVVTFTYVDNNSNEASCSFTVTILTDTPCGPNPCFNGGACVVNSLTEYQCVCSECYTGTNCETQLNACDANLCQNGAACIAHEGSCDSYFCECPSCFVGIYCDVPVDACDNHQCQNGGACVVDDNTCLTYTCSCPLCYTGEFCQTKVDACDNHGCQNGAACEPVGDLCTEYTCQCSGCFTGDLCDEVRDPCSPSPCLNNAQCTTLGDNCYSYSCECTGCYTGFNCEDAIPSPCENSPCQNGGACSVIAGVCSGYQCTCPDGYTGVNCEDVTIVNTNPCNNFPCDNGGTCMNIDSNFYSCICRDGYTGINCQTPTANSPSQDSCTSAPCLNGATCVNSYDSNSGVNFFLPQYTCICQSGFTGTNCGSTTVSDPLLDVCTNGNEQPCQNGGVCYNMYQSLSQGVDTFCDCPIGWTGHSCETPATNPCASGPCENGGVCMPSNTYFECDCLDGFFGTTCEIAQGDQDPPTISNCPDDITRTISSASGVSVTWLEPTATDAGTTQRLLRSHVPGSFFQLGDTAITYVFTDNSENLAKCTFIVTVTLAETDNTPPIIQNCPSTSVAQATGGSTTAQVSWVEPSANDDSGVAVRVTNNYNPGQSFPVGDTVVAYTFTDDAGNQNTCTFTVRVVVEVINQSPTITFCPAGPLVYSTLGADEVIVNFPAPTAVDDSGLSPSVNANYQPGQSFAVGTYAVMYTFSDNFGLTSNCNFNIEVVAGGDVRPPTISNCPAQAITALAPAGASSTVVTWTAPSATDESGSVSSSSTSSPGTFFQVGTTTVIYTFTDLAGNEAQCVFNVIVTGTNVNVTPAPSNLVLAPGTTTITASWTPPNGAFNSYQITISGGSTVNTQTLPQSSSSYTAIGLNPATTYIVSLLATGNAGSSSSISESTTTNPEQGQPPSSASNLRFFATENSINVNFDAASGDVTGYTLSIGTTSNANDVTTTLAPGATSYIFGNLAASTLYFISLQAFNNFGSSPSVVETVTTSDVVTPGSDIVISNCPVSVSASLPFGTFAFVEWDEPTATSSLGAVTTVNGPPNSSGYFVTGTFPILYEFEDVNGNSVSCSFSVYVTDGSDTTAPEITSCPSDISIQAPSGATSTTASWNTPTATDVSTPVTAVSNYSPGDSFNVDTTTQVVYYLIDAAGYYSTCSFGVTVSSGGVIVDRENPVLTGCPTDIVSNANPGASTSVVTWLAPVASDNSGTPALTVTIPPGSTFPVGSTEVTYTATDAAGNFVSCSFNVIVLSTGDNTSPVLSSCPADQTLSAAQNAQGAVATWTTPTATDNSGDQVFVTSSPNSGSLFQVGPTTVIVTATDSSGNIDTCSFTITVVGATDNVGPVTSNCPSSQTVTAAVGSSSAVATWTSPIFTDGSGVASVNSNFVSGSSFPIGSTTVTYTAIDFLGNVGECSFSINVNTGNDGTDPTFINCPSSIDATVPFGTSGTTVTWTEPIAVDNSGSVNTVSTRSSGTFFQVGVVSVVYTATDSSGNIGTCSFLVTVTEEALVDVTPPELFNCPTGISATANPGASFAIVTWTPPTATDNLGVPVVTSNLPSGSSFPVGSTQVIYTAVDDFGNDAFCSFSVVVSSGTTNAAPVVTFCPNNGQIYFTSPSANSANVDFAPPTATDDSGSVTATSTNEPGDEFAVGIHTVTYTFSDLQGLTAQCTFSFEVQVGANPCSSNPCAPSEQCFYIPSQYLCINNGRRRRAAEMIDLSDICPCENGGRCLLDDMTSSATCECPIGYAGVLCEIDTMPAANVNVHSSYREDHEIQAWSNGNSALLWSVIICMAIMLVVIISLSGLLCYVVPRLTMVRQRRSKVDEIPILQ